MINNFKKVKIHDQFEVSALDFMGRNKQQLVSVGNNYFMNFYDVETLTLQKQINLEHQLSSLHINGPVIIVGNGKGELITMDKCFDIIHKQKFHTDCVTDIFEQGSKIITVGYDGLVNFIDRRTYGIINTMDLDSPLNQITKFNGKYYIAGIESFTIDQEHNIEKIGRYDQFLPIGKNLFATNDHNGFTYMNTNDRKYVPCERMVAYKNGVLGTSGRAVTYFQLDEEQRVWWKGTALPEINRGDSMTSMAVRDNMVFAAGQTGHIYMFSFDQSHSWLMS